MVVKARKAGAKEQNERSDGKSRRGREGKSAQIHGKNSAIIRHKLVLASSPSPPLLLLRALFICALGTTTDLMFILSQSESFIQDCNTTESQQERCDVLKSECGQEHYNLTSSSSSSSSSSSFSVRLKLNAS